MKRLIALATAAALAGCGGSDTQEGTFESADGEEGSYAISSDDDGQSAVSIKTEDGEFNMRMGSGGTVNYVEGLSGYPGMAVINSTDVNYGEGRNASVTFMTKDKPAEVVEFYRKQAEAGGFKVNTEVKMDQSLIIGGDAEDGRTFSLNVSPSEEGGSAANLGFSEKTGQ